LPNDVDYIRTKPNNYNVSLNNTLPKTESGGNPISAVISRLRNALLPKGALPNVPQDFARVMQQDYQMWGKVARDLNLNLD
jgi:hypothetical protein